MAYTKNMKFSEYFGKCVGPAKYMGKARDLREASEEPESVEMLYEAVKNFPDDFLLHYQLGKSLFFLNRYDEAVDSHTIGFKPSSSDEKRF